jgi:diguanylate cyclase (GGDEF)-like protein
MSSVPTRVDSSSPARSALGTLVTQQLRVLLEQRAVRIAVIGICLVGASAFTYLPASDPGTAEWLFIVPVAVASIAAGLREGLITAFVAAVMAGIFAVDRIETIDFSTILLAIFSARVALFGIIAAVLGAFAEAHYSVQDHLRQLALLDPLTKVSNVERFHHEIRMLDAANIPYAVMVTDLDNLKGLNDKFGHQAGSAAIQSTANVLRKVVRTTDLVARFGGDEFVVILREADRVGAQIVMNRVRKMLSEEVLPTAPGEILKVSMGVAISGEDGSSPDELIRNADEAMYLEKRSRKATGEITTR